MLPASCASWAKEQLTGPGMHEAQASLRSCLAQCFNEAETGQRGVRRLLVLQAQVQSSSLGKRNGQKPHLFLSFLPSQKQLLVIQFNLNAVVLWIGGVGRKIMGFEGCYRVTVDHWKRKGDNTCFLSVLKCFISKLGYSQMSWELFLQRGNYACSI